VAPAFAVWGCCGAHVGDQHACPPLRAVSPWVRHCAPRPGRRAARPVPRDALRRIPRWKRPARCRPSGQLGCSRGTPTPASRLPTGTFSVGRSRERRRPATRVTTSSTLARVSCKTHGESAPAGGAAV
jgi:hypothetical protein